MNYHWAKKSSSLCNKLPEGSYHIMNLQFSRLTRVKSITPPNGCWCGGEISHFQIVRSLTNHQPGWFCWSNSPWIPNNYSIVPIWYGMVWYYQDNCRCSCVLHFPKTERDRNGPPYVHCFNQYFAASITTLVGQILFLCWSNHKISPLCWAITILLAKSPFWCNLWWFGTFFMVNG